MRSLKFLAPLVLLLPIALIGSVQPIATVRADQSTRSHDNIVPNIAGLWLGEQVRQDIPKPPRKFKTGAKHTPPHKMASAVANGSLKVHKNVTLTPPQFAMVPKKLSMWLNDSEGDCVSASEAAQIAAYSQAATGTEYFIQDATVQAFCRKYNTCNGADLLEVIQQMQKDGMHQGGDTIQDGTSSVVNFSDDAALQNAISQGPVKIGIDANALPSGAGNNQGWSAFGGRPGQYSNEDHCVELFGYGPTVWLCQQLGTPVPAGAPERSYLLYTWNTIGLVDHAWIMSTVGEAFLRGPLILNGKAMPALNVNPPTPPPAGVGSVNLEQPITAGTFNVVSGGTTIATITAASSVPAGQYAIVASGPVSARVGTISFVNPTGPATFVVTGVGPLAVTGMFNAGTTYDIVPATAADPVKQLREVAEKWRVAQRDTPNVKSDDLILAHAAVDKIVNWLNANPTATTLPPPIVVMLSLLCGLSSVLPAPYNTLAQLFCGLIPH